MTLFSRLFSRLSSGLFILMTFLFSGIALAADLELPAFLNLPEGTMVKVIAWIIGIQAICFGIGKGLTEIAVHTENKYDNMIANGFSKVAWFLGTVIAKFGFGQPKQVTLAQAEKLNSEDKK